MSVMKKIALISFAALLLGGCTRSIESQYTPSFTKGTDQAVLSGAKIGVAKLEDKRSWVAAGDEQSKSFIGQAGSWKFGLTFGGKEFTPVDTIVRTAIVEELRRAGAASVAIDTTLGSKDLSKFDATAAAAKVDYVLGGDLTVFEFVNETGLVTVTSRRAVSLSIKMKRVGKDALVIDQSYVQNDRENEGLGVMHSTNVNKLLNNALRNSVHKIVSDVSLALKVPENRVSVTVEIDGVALLAH